MEGKTLATFNVILDCAGLVTALVLVVLVVSKTDRSLATYYVLPLILLCVHVYGNTVQELELGPVWIRNHLHNVGVAGLSLTVGPCFNLRDIKRDRQLGYSQRHIVNYTMNFTLGYWFIATAFGFVQEIVTVTILDGLARRAGYSGKLDWFDLSSYAIGATIVTLNHLWFRRRILAKLRQEPCVR